MTTQRPTAKQFLEDFTRDLVKHPGGRPEIIAGYAKHMEAREEALTRRFYDVFHNKGNHPAYHDEQVEYLRRHWPMLYELLVNLPEPGRGDSR